MCNLGHLVSQGTKRFSAKFPNTFLQMNTQFLQGTEVLLTWCYINRVHFVVETVQVSLKIDLM